MNPYDMVDSDVVEKAVKDILPSHKELAEGYLQYLKDELEVRREETKVELATVEKQKAVELAESQRKATEDRYKFLQGAYRPRGFWGL